MSKIKCMICGEEFERINYSHLKTHGITREEYCDRFPDASLTSEEERRRISEIFTGRNKENDESIKRGAEKRTGRTKENYEYLRRQGEKYKETCKNPTVAMIEGYKKISKAKTGRTKENDESVRRIAEKNTGLTKENNEGKRRVSEKMIGKIPTPAMIEGYKKQREKLKGRTKENDEGVRRRAKGLTGKIPTQAMIEGRKKQSEKTRGELAPNWKGGISNLPYCEKFDDDLKERVRIFFGRCCYICGKSEQEQIDEMIKEGKNPIKNLDVHHVNFDKMVCCNDVEPLFVPLCRSCHTKTNHNREEWEEFFTASLEYLTNSKCFYTKEEMILKNNSYKK